MGWGWGGGGTTLQPTTRHNVWFQTRVHVCGRPKHLQEMPHRRYFGIWTVRSKTTAINTNDAFNDAVLGLL